MTLDELKLELDALLAEAALYLSDEECERFVEYMKYDAGA